jgi:PBP1b-binding outer membrane lipoprotein LpoB
MKKVLGIAVMGSMLLLAGCNGNKDTKEPKEKVEQSTEQTEEMKVYREIHEKYDVKMNKEINKALQLWEVAKEKGGKEITSAKYKEEVQKVTTGMLEDIDHIRKEIRVPKSKEDEHEMYVGFLNEAEQAMKKLQKLAKEEDSSLIRDIEINFSTASTYYKRFQTETEK